MKQWKILLFVLLLMTVHGATLFVHRPSESMNPNTGVFRDMLYFKSDIQQVYTLRLGSNNSNAEVNSMPAANDPIFVYAFSILGASNAELSGGLMRTPPWPRLQSTEMDGSGWMRGHDLDWPGSKSKLTEIQRLIELKQVIVDERPAMVTEAEIGLLLRCTESSAVWVAYGSGPFGDIFYCIDQEKRRLYQFSWLHRKHEPKIK